MNNNYVNIFFKLNNLLHNIKHQTGSLTCHGGENSQTVNQKSIEYTIIIIKLLEDIDKHICIAIKKNC